MMTSNMKRFLEILSEEPGALARFYDMTQNEVYALAAKMGYFLSPLDFGETLCSRPGVGRRMLEAAIRREKRDRTECRVRDRRGCHYTLDCPTAPGRELKLDLEFYHLDKKPEPGDRLYFSGNLASGLKECLHSYYFSAEIGSPCAREPHDFLLDPREFLILEYRDMTTILLEQHYG